MPMPPEMRLLGELKSIGRLCEATGLALTDVASLPAELADRLMIVVDTIDDYREWLRKQQEQYDRRDD